MHAQNHWPTKKHFGIDGLNDLHSKVLKVSKSKKPKTCK